MWFQSECFQYERGREREGGRRRRRGERGRGREGQERDREVERGREVGGGEERGVNEGMQCQESACALHRVQNRGKR